MTPDLAQNDDGSTALCVRLTDDELQDRLDEHFHKVLKAEWQKHEESLRGGHARGFRPGHVPRRMIEQHFGGPARAYEAVYSDLVTRTFFEQAGRPCLVFTNLRIEVTPRDTSDPVTNHAGSTAVRATVWPAPKVRFPDQFDLVLVEPVLQDPDDQVTQILEREQARRTSYEGKDGPLAEEDHAVVSVVARQADGSLWEHGQMDRATVGLAAGELFPEAMRLGFLGHRAGDVWEQDIVLDETMGPLVGLALRQECRVHSVMRPVVPSLDDAFAREHGYESLAVWRANLLAIAGRAHEQRRREQLADQLVERISGLADVDPIPEAWIQVFTATRLADLTRAFSEQDRMLSAYGVQDHAALMVKLSEEGRVSLRRELAVLAYGERIGLQVVEQTAMQMGEHLPEVLDKALSTVTTRGHHDVGEAARFDPPGPSEPDAATEPPGTPTVS